MPITHQASAKRSAPHPPPLAPLRSRFVPEEQIAGSARSYPPPGVLESVWPSQLTILVAIVLQLTLPARLTVGPSWLLPALEGALGVGMAMATPRELEGEHPLRRRVAIGLVMLVSAANVFSL